MLPWLWMVLISQLNPSIAAPTFNGPTSKEEAEILWKESQKAIQKGNYQDAVNSLQRYVDRYPGQPNYLESQFFLGKAYRELGRENEAIPFLRAFIEARSSNESSVQARIELSHAYLKLKKFSEALLAAMEAESKASASKSASDFKVEALVVKSEALLGLNRESEANHSLGLAKLAFTSQINPRVKALTYDLELQIKTRQCSHLNLKGTLDEGQIRNQLERRGNCLLEALLIFQKTVNVGYTPSSEHSYKQFEDSYFNYLHACAHPPSFSRSFASIAAAQADKEPGQSTPTKSTSIRYQQELADILIEDCRKKSLEALDLVDTWKQKFPQKSKPYSLKISKILQNLPAGDPRNP